MGSCDDHVMFPEANKHDFRGYYGLGHTYEILRMPFFALHYYNEAYKLRQVAAWRSREGSPDARVVCTDLQTRVFCMLWARVMQNSVTSTKPRRWVWRNSVAPPL